MTNQPAATGTDPDGRERLVNLTFALLHLPPHSPGVNAEWIRTNVAGYNDKSDSAFAKLFRRDRATLAVVGVPIEVRNDADCGKLYRLRSSRYSLPELSFTPEEASIIALAGEQGLSAELSAFARSGWTKIAAGGARSNIGSRSAATPAHSDGEEDSYSVVSDLSKLSALTFDRVLRACRRGHAITFIYRPHPGSPPQRRRMDPWSLVPLGPRIYMVGFDTDREAIRSFRLSRITELTEDGPAQHVCPPGFTPTQFVQESISNFMGTVDAIIEVRSEPSFSSELVRASDAMADMNSGPERRAAKGVDRRWLVRTAIAEAPEVMVVSPPEVVEEIRSTLQGFLAANALNTASVSGRSAARG